MPSATIIGAGPAGSIAAIVLARRGWDVTLIEQHRFPRGKVCGECISALGIDVLRRLGLADHLRARSLTSAALIACDGGRAHLRLPRPMWGLSRSALDSALLQHARQSGVHVEQPVRCEATDADGVLLVRDLVTNSTRRIEADHVLIADGKSRRHSGDLGIKAHFVGVAEDEGAISLFGLRGHYVGAAPVEGGRWNLCMSVPAKGVHAFGGDLDALLAQCLADNDGLRESMRRARRVSEWLASPLPRHPVSFSSAGLGFAQHKARHFVPGPGPKDRALRGASRGSIIPIGNAAAAIEPIGGEGIGLAMRSAELAAESLASSWSPETLARGYSRLWRTRRVACRAAGIVMSSPLLSHLAVSFLSTLDEVSIEKLLRLIGKSEPDYTPA